MKHILKAKKRFLCLLRAGALAACLSPAALAAPDGVEVAPGYDYTCLLYTSRAFYAGKHHGPGRVHHGVCPQHRPGGHRHGHLPCACLLYTSRCV